MKRFFAGTLCLCLLFSMACAQEAETPDTLDTLAMRAYRMSRIMGEMAESPEYLEMMSSSSEIKEAVRQINQCDWDAPQGMALLYLDQEEAAWLEQLLGELVLQGEIPADTPRMMDALRIKLVGGIGNTLNGAYGATWLAATVILNVGDVFPVEGGESGSAWAIIFYGEEQPCVLASFTLCEGAVRADATVVRLPDAEMLPGLSIREILMGGQGENGEGSLPESLFPGETRVYSSETVRSWEIGEE